MYRGAGEGIGRCQLDMQIIGSDVRAYPKDFYGNRSQNPVIISQLIKKWLQFHEYFQSPNNLVGFAFDPPKHYEVNEHMKLLIEGHSPATVSLNEMEKYQVLCIRCLDETKFEHDLTEYSLSGKFWGCEGVHTNKKDPIILDKEETKEQWKKLTCAQQQLEMYRLFRPTTKSRVVNMDRRSRLNFRKA
jgi:hypothetical protein